MTDHTLKALPLLTNEELGVLNAAISIHLAMVEPVLELAPTDAVLRRRANILNSLRTAVAEARANGG